MINIDENTIKEVEERIKTFNQSNDYRAAYLYYKKLSEAVKMVDLDIKKNNQMFFNKLINK